jgi:hypothetical protein
MVKLRVAVALLLMSPVAGMRVQAQSEQFASNDQTTFVEDAPAGAAVSAPTVVAIDVPAPAIVDLPVPVVEDAAAPVTSDEPAPVAVEATIATGPSMESAALSPRYSSHDVLSTHEMRRPSRGSGVGLMIFGGAALITGLIIGDDAGTVIAVGGALVGLYGLYVYLGRPTGMGNGQASHSERIGLGYKLNTN